MGGAHQSPLFTDRLQASPQELAEGPGLLDLTEDRLGQDLALKFLTAYLVEKSLSVDNLFVFMLIFAYFGVPNAYQHKALFWGIIGALVMRGIFIAAGITLLHFFHWFIYAFGILLILSAVKIAFSKDKQIEPENNPLLRLTRRFISVTEDYEHEKFFVRRSGRLFATPLLIVLIVIESSDVMFAVDSIPAVLGISTDPLIVFSSNIFAILGLRALYFVLAGVMKLFHYLHYGLTFILVFIGVKMLLTDIYHIPTSIALLILAAVLAISIIASLVWPAREKKVKVEVDVGQG